LGLGLGITTVTGCQTYFGGMTLPSPHYLKHPPQYFPPDPQFPLQREYDQMLDPEGAVRRGAVGAAAAPALPAAPGAVAGPLPNQGGPASPAPNPGGGAGGQGGPGR
jgi:hypothetical protein